jgi:hypothetical protein
MATPSALTPASGAPTPASANASGPLASLLASAEKFASPSVSADERYRVVCEIREIASDLAISHEYPNFLSRFVPLFDDFLHKEVPSGCSFSLLPLAELYSRSFHVPRKTLTRKRACAFWTFCTSICRSTRACGLMPVNFAF